MLTKKKVLFIIWSFTYGGGAERILANIVNNLDADKYDIEVLEYLHSDRHQESINSNVKLLKPIIDETQNDILSKLKKRIINEYAIMHCPGVVRRLFLNRVYDIEVSFNYMIPTFLLNRSSGMLVSWMHGSIENLKCDDESRDIQRAYLGKVDKIVTISKKTQDSVIDVYPEFKSKTIQIYNGYNFEKMCRLGNDYKVDRFDLLYCNRLDDNKNPILLLKVLKYLESKGLVLKVMILGEGKLQDTIEDLLNKMKLKSIVKLCGYEKNPYPYFKSCRVFCLTSIAEGFPTTIVEAMYFGKPFVSTNVAGADELSKNRKCGFVVDSCQEFADCVSKLLSNNMLYAKMSKCCLEEVTNYSLSSQINGIENIFSRLSK